MEATEAAEAMLRFGFEQLGLKEIWAGADLDNAASFRVMEGLGMTRVGERLVGPRRVRALYYRLSLRAHGRGLPVAPGPSGACPAERGSSKGSSPSQGARGHLAPRLGGAGCGR